MTKHRISDRARLLAWLLAFAAILSLLPVAAFASEEETQAVEESVQPYVNVIEPPSVLDENRDIFTENEVGEIPSDNDEPEKADEPADAEGPASEEPESADEEPSEEPAPEIDGDEETFTVSYYNSSTLLSEEQVKKGQLPKNVPTVIPGTGVPIAAWTDPSGHAAAVSATPVTADTAYYACPMPELERTLHIRYINGDGTGNFNPDSPLTRAQAAVILGTLLKADAPGPIEAVFTDVAGGKWYSDPIALLASYGIVSGYREADGTYTFRPNNSVTRAEFVSMLVRATGAAGEGSHFTDISAHWARTQIEAAAANGWISGYQEADGSYTFRPQRAISRAEAVTIVNRVVGRAADMDELSSKGASVVFADVSPSAWYYGAIMEASIEHQYDNSSGRERWINYNPQLEVGIHLTGGRWYLVGADGQIVSMKAGINEVGGRFYYAESAGQYFTGDLSTKKGYVVFSDGTEKALSNKFNLIGSTLFYWDLNSSAAKKLSKGLNDIDGTTYWADEDGYVIRNNFFEGVVELDGKKYLSRGYCDIITTGLGYTSTTSKPTNIDLREQTYEYNNQMYYLKSDYSLACDEWIEYLYFGTDCAYTCGDATLDGYVWNVVKDFINNTALTKEQKLLKAYYYIRGGQGSTYAASPFKYRRYDFGYKRGRCNEQIHYSWILNAANTMFTQKAGMCYEWASIYLLMARRLGFQSYIVVGSVFQQSTRHCWCMIKWDGKWHISDVEIEWGYLAGWYSSQAVYRNLFAQTVSTEYFSTYQNPECALTYWVWDE